MNSRKRKDELLSDIMHFRALIKMAKTEAIKSRDKLISDSNPVGHSKMWEKEGEITAYTIIEHSLEWFFMQ